MATGAWTDAQVKAYIDKTPGLSQGDNPYGAEDMARARAAMGAAPTATPTAAAPTPAKTTPVSGVVAGTPQAGQVNVADVSGAYAANPNTALGKGTTLAAAVPTISGSAPGTLINPNDPEYKKQTTVANKAATVAPVVQGATNTYDAATTEGDVAAADMTAAQGEVSDDTIIDPNEVPQIDVESIASGYNPDGTLNATGQALQEFASLELDDVDPRATAQGQLEALQKDFTGPNGEPKIPIWAQANARAVGRIMAFKGVTGTAAMATMSTAMMEASIPIAMADAQFYQTVTLQNLNNEQEATLNRANVLSKFELTNADNRMAAAIQNAQSFLAMDMKNLDNEQQARVINNQNRVQSILEDAKAENTARMFNANSKNEQDRFYDNLNTQIKQYNATAVNDMTKFNSELNNQREQFYKSMQFNIDTANAKWRQTVTLTNADMKFQAAATDVKNRIDISQEALNRLWDRSDALLDYVWKGAENEKDRKSALLISTNTNKANAKAATSEGLGSIAGAIAGPLAEGLASTFFK
jgi:hypothetical protein